MLSNPNFVFMKIFLGKSEKIKSHEKPRKSFFFQCVQTDIFIHYLFSRFQHCPEFLAICKFNFSK